MSTHQDYQEQADNNKEKFMESLKLAYPELYVVAKLIDDTNFNPLILFHTIRHVSEIAQGTGFGQVHILIEDGVVKFIKGEHSSKLIERVFNQKDVI